MVKTTELRIGNFVYNDTMQLGTVSDIHHSMVIVKTEKNPYSKSILTKPVTITPELLERFGFKQASDPDMFKHPCGLWITRNAKGKGYFFTGMRANRYLKFIHELQNAAFAMTGEELTATPSTPLHQSSGS